MACTSLWAPSPVHVPFIRCGRCKGCQLHRRLQWVSRLMLEAAFNPCKPIFLTLTYNSRALAELRARVDDPELVFDAAHIYSNRFYKRLRNRDCSPRYFHATERGTANRREHHHAVVWLGGNFRARKILDLVKECWPEGRLDWSFVRGMGALRYVGKYATKDGDARYCWSKSPTLGHAGVQRWRTLLAGEIQKEEIFLPRHVPGFLTCTVLGRRANVAIPEQDFKRACRELGVQYAPDIQCEIAKALVGAPTGPLNMELVRRRYEPESPKGEGNRSSGSRTPPRIPVASDWW